MAKIGTAHIEIKPVLDEQALEALAARIEDAVTRAIIRAGSKHPFGRPGVIPFSGRSDLLNGSDA